MTAVAAAGLSITANHNTQALPLPSTTGALLRLGTDSRVWAASDIVFEAQTPVDMFPETGQFYGWHPLVELVGSNESIGPDDGELPLFSMFSPEIPQRNVYVPEAANWSSAGLPAEWMPLTSSEAVRRNGRRTLYVHGVNHSAMPAGAVLASFDLADNPELSGSPVYFAFESQCSAGATLSLMIDPGDGRWQHSNSSKGLECPRALGFGWSVHEQCCRMHRSSGA